jgi:hypothetical protein
MTSASSSGTFQHPYYGETNSSEWSGNKVLSTPNSWETPCIVLSQTASSQLSTPNLWETYPLPKGASFPGIYLSTPNLWETSFFLLLSVSSFNLSTPVLRETYYVGVGACDRSTFDTRLMGNFLPNSHKRLVYFNTRFSGKQILLLSPRRT